LYYNKAAAMKKYTLILLFLSGSISLFSQNISKELFDKLFSDFMKYKNTGITDNSVIKQEPVKCGFVLINSVRVHFNSFTYEQQQLLKPLLTRPVLQVSIVSPSGFFRIHYDTIGINTPVYYTAADTLHYSKQALLQLYLDSTAITADSAYNFEINNLGYPPPPSDDTAGGDNKYDIYLWNLGSYYGDTQFDGNKGPSYMEVNSNFTGFPTLGIYAVRVTVAHEFHHSIQVGNYIYRDADAWFHELTSVSMEHFVYPSIHDYYNYMSHYFDNPQRSIASNDVSGGDGYDLAIWNIYLQKKFDYGIIKKQWELMPQMRAIEAINQSVIGNGASFSQILNEFGIWVYFTGSRAQQGKYFPEAGNYPSLSFPVSNSFLFPPFVPVNSFNNPVSNNFFNISIQLPAKADILVPVITNSDYEAAVNNIESTFNFNYSLYNYNVPGTINLVDKYYSKLNTTESSWFNSEILNNTWLGSTVVFNHNADFAFPSPFNYSYPVLYIPVDQNSSGEFTLNVYSIGMKLVYSSTVSLIKLDKEKPVIAWDGKDNNNRKLSSGVYIYAVKSGNDVKKGKIVIFNE
jgi:hypothetical protein